MLRFQQIKNALFANILLYVSYMLVHLQAKNELGISWKETLDLGLILAFPLMFYIVCAVNVLPSFLLRVFHWRQSFIWSFFAILIWFIFVSNVFYFHYFGRPLSLWVIKLHWQDVESIGVASANLYFPPQIMVSMLFLALAIFFQRRHALSVSFKQTKKMSLEFFGKLTFPILFILGMVICRQSTFWIRFESTRHRLTSNPINHPILFAWRYEVKEREAIGRVHGKLGLKDKGNVHGFSRFLKTLQEINKPTFKHEEESYLKLSDLYDRYKNDDNLEQNYPLTTYKTADLKISKERKVEFGFSPDAKVNVLALFIESGRSYELLDPKLGPLVWPELRRILKNNAIFYPNFYSSSLDAGMTVRGQYSTLCSMLPNLKGPAMFIAFPTVNTKCFAGLAKENLYNTLWVSGYNKAFHNKFIFESSHGTDYFFDQQWFEENGVRERNPKWGLKDKGVLLKLVDLMEDWNKRSEPFFINFITLSTHFPFTPFDEVRLDSSLDVVKEKNEEYYGYLTRLKYTDEALSLFFDKFFKSRISENTIVLLIGDHSFKIDPPRSLSSYQQKEIRHRVIFSMISKNIKNPRIETMLAHQIDVAPTLSNLLGLNGHVSWLGQDLFSGIGSPWLYYEWEKASYRVPGRGCYYNSQSRDVDCYEINQDEDPMFSNLKKVPEIKSMQSYFYKMAEAEGQVNQGNGIMAPDFSKLKTQAIKAK